MKKIVCITIICFSVAAFTSCKKFLEKTPINQATDQNFWTNESEANNGIAGAYAMLRAAMNEMGFAHFYYGDFATDEFMVPPGGEDYVQLNRIEWNTFVSSAELHRAMIRLRRWDNFYRAVDAANRGIKFIQEIPVERFSGSNKQQVKNDLLGEAYFIRAFTYFYMARIWGDVPLSLQFIPDAAKADLLSRAPQSEVLDQVIRDAETALSLMVWKPAFTPSRAIRVSKGATYALLAHVHAWKGDYAKVIPAADSVMVRGGYTYVSRASQAAYLAMFKGNSSEGIFEIAQNANNEAQVADQAYGAINNSVAGRTLKEPYLATKTGNSNFPLDRVTLETFFPNTIDSNDYRRKNGFAFWGTTDPITIKYSSGIIYTGPNNTSPLSLHNIIVFRLADIALLKAEALAATTGMSAARTLLNQIRTLNNASPFMGPDNLLFSAIIDERGRELFLEGHRFYDLVRLARRTGEVRFNGSSGAARMDNAQFQQGKYYWPVDPITVLSNPLITQTPFWRDKM